MRAKRPVSGETGIALITTVIILLMLGALAAVLSGMVYSRFLSVTLEEDPLPAAYLAEAGLARGLYEISKDRDEWGGDGKGAIPPTGFGPGYFTVQLDPKSRTLVGVGVVRDVRRVIVNKY